MTFSGFFTQAGNVLGIVTILLAVVTLVSWLTKQPWRFRLFGTTAFMVVLTSGVWTLAIIPAIVRPKVEGAQRFVTVFDRGGGRAVIVVSPTITAEALRTTLRKAALDLGSTGRALGTGSPFKIQARVVVHPKPGVSRIIPVGSYERTVGSSTEPKIDVDAAALSEARRIAATPVAPAK